MMSAFLNWHFSDSSRFTFEPFIRNGSERDRIAVVGSTSIFCRLRVLNEHRHRQQALKVLT